MMVLPALMTAASSIGGAVATGAGAAATAVGSASALTVAKGAVTAFSAFAGMSAARADGYELERRAQEERLLGQTEFTEARREVTTLNREFTAVAGQQRVAFAANGIDLGSGSVRAARRQSARESDRQVQNVLDDAFIRKRQRDARSNSYQKSARDKRKGGLFGAVGKVGGFVIGELG